MLHVLACIQHDHDGRLLLAAALVCTVGVFASFAVGTHAHRSVGRARRFWSAVSVVSAGCTAWATHFVALLAFRPALPSAYDPVLTAASLLAAIVGLGVGVILSLRSLAMPRRFLAGAIIGLSVALLHYLGQSAYLIRGHVTWNLGLVAVSVLAGTALAMLGLAARGLKGSWRGLAAPLLLLSIAVLHFCGMAAMTVRYDPAVVLPRYALPEATVTPVVVSICTGLLVLAILGLWFDIATRLRLRRDQQRLRELADVALEGLLLCRGDEILAANSSVAMLTGREASALTGRFVSTLLPGLDVPSLPEREEREAELIDAGGQSVPVRVLRREVAVGHRRQTVLAVRDQRERLRTEEKMRLLAFSDPLTGLLNRTRFYDLLAVHAESRRKEDRCFSVLMIDLDRFKPVNDTFGHATGDLVLRMVGDRLCAAAREGDVVARLGGDEFVILQLGTADGGAEALAARVVEELGRHPFMVNGHAVSVGASVGIASAPRDGTDPADLLHNADLALYAAKADGKGRFRHYDPALDERLRERRKLEDELRRALALGELELHYQPLVDSGSGRITSAEALVRWRHPERGLVPPSDFIGIAEEAGLIGALGEWVMRTACYEAAGWPADVMVAVNLSPAQFREPGLAAMIGTALDDAGLEPGRLEVEITEGVLLTDERSTLATLNELRRTGVRISMDDFGTGYSSLSYLRRFPFDKIKIDQSFVQQLPNDPESAAIIRAIITMGRCLGMTTTVEGVETPDQFAFSKEEGCDFIQGFLVSRPLVASAFRDFLASGSGESSNHERSRLGGTARLKTKLPPLPGEGASMRRDLDKALQS